MTQPHEVTVTDAEVHAVRVILRAELSMPDPDVDLAYKTALARFLAPRVPGKMVPSFHGELHAARVETHNALRDAVLKGPQG